MVAFFKDISCQKSLVETFHGRKLSRYHAFSETFIEVNLLGAERFFGKIYVDGKLEPEERFSIQAKSGCKGLTSRGILPTKSWKFQELPQGINFSSQNLRSQELCISVGRVNMNKFT